MKKTLLTMALVAASAAAFAQGKISFQNDSLHLVYYTGTGTSLDGSAAYAGNLPGGVTALSADLYLGTAGNALSLYTTTTFSTIGPGQWNSVNVAANAPAIPGGTHAFVLAVITDNGATAPATLDGTQSAANLLAIFQAAGAKWFGSSIEFTYTLGSSITYPPMWNANGNWTAGTQPMNAVGAGYMGAIGVAPVPEPTSLALAGLGAAAMMIFRRRK